jgi:hypothetical protein
MSLPLEGKMHTNFVHILIESSSIKQPAERDLDAGIELLGVSEPQTSKVVDLNEI